MRKKENRRSQAFEVIKRMQLGEWRFLSDLAAQAGLRTRQMARFLVEVKKQSGQLQNRTRIFTVNGFKMQRSQWRKLDGF